MKALYFNKKLQYLTDYSKPVPEVGETLVRVLAAGICNTDIEIMKGYMGYKGILGHEFVGIVEGCSDDRLTGRRVVGEINAGCGKCSFCIRGMPNHCPDRSVLGILNRDGAFAEYLTLPAANLHIVPDSISDAEAVFVEPVAAACEILEQVQLNGKRVCVLGDGKLGLIAAQVLAASAGHTTIAGRHREKLDLIKNKRIKRVLSSELDERGFDVLVDCTGSHEGIEQAMTLVRPGGTIIMKTTVSNPGNVDLTLPQHHLWRTSGV